MKDVGQEIDNVQRTRLGRAVVKPSRFMAVMKVKERN